MTLSVPDLEYIPSLITKSAPVALKVEGLSVGYAGQSRAITSVSFEVNQGERIAVIGPNGAGKSTLFKALVGLIPHASGEISLHGEDCRTSHTMIGYVPQQEAIDWNFPVTVYDVVMMGRARKIGWLRWPRKHDRAAVHAALEQVGMRDYHSRQIGQLSGGQKRRVFIARALAQETDLLLLDEPFSGVDIAAEEEIMETLDELQASGITVLLATHDLNTAAARFDRILLLNGCVITYGHPEHAFQPEALKAAYGRRIGIFQQNKQTVIVADEHDQP
jgi:ABC-type Mn2+/Zn2+ transport system ATPase subunit